MPLLDISDARPAMVLAKAVEDELGRIVLNAGDVLTEQLIHALKRRGVTQIRVRDATPKTEPRGAPGRAEVAAALEARFSRAKDGDSAMQALKRVVRAVLLPEEV